MRHSQGAATNSKTGNRSSDFRLIAFAGRHHKIKFRSPTRPPSRFEFSIPLFHQPPDGEHDGETSQRHEQRTDDEKGRGGHYQSAEKWKQGLLPPAIDHVTTGDGAPDARRPEIMLIEPIMLIEQIHCCSICRNLIQLTSDWLAGACAPWVHLDNSARRPARFQNWKLEDELPFLLLTLLGFAVWLHRLTVTLHEWLLFQPGNQFIGHHTIITHSGVC